MGCTPSGSPQGDAYEGAEAGAVGAAASVLERYLQLERDLWREEKAAPAPSLHHAAARLDAAAAALAAARLRIGAGPPPDTPPPPTAQPPPQQRLDFQRVDAASQVPQTSTSIRDVLLDLKIDRNPVRAAEHEEFIANINRQELARNEVALLERRVEEAEEEVKMATAKVNYLQTLYQEQDQLLGDVFGEQYGSPEERRLELRLDRLRSFRDTLAGGELEWREAHALALAAAADMRHAVAAWERLASSNDAEARTQLLLETRARAQAAAASAAAAHAALPGAGLPACTPRELAAVAHALLYIFTDAQDPDKAAHAGRLYRHFWLRACELADWIRKTMANTLQKDLSDVDKQVAVATAELRALRMQLIREKLGVPGHAMGKPEAVPYAKVVTAPFGAGFDTHYPGTLAAGPALDPRRRLEHSALFGGGGGASGGRALYGPSPQRRTSPADDISPDALRRDLASNLRTASPLQQPLPHPQQQGRWGPAPAERRVWGAYPPSV